MITYQDLLEVGEDIRDRAEFTRKVIEEYCSGVFYKTAWTAREYDKNRNVTTVTYQKYLTQITGQLVPDTISPTHRNTSNLFHIALTQRSKYSLGNGVRWNEDRTAQLGKNFDVIFSRCGRNALRDGASYVFYNLNKVKNFTALELAPIYDEETGELAAAVRFWQLDDAKPRRAELYEREGYTAFLWDKQGKTHDGWNVIDDGVWYQERRPYVVTVRGDAKDAEDGTLEETGQAVTGFPIVPFYANEYHQSEIVGMRETIDTYDFILNGFADDLDNAQLYWIISGAAGTTDKELVRFLDRLRTVKAAAPADGQDVTPVQVDIPHSAREKLLDRLKNQFYSDAMLLNPADIAGGAATATQIRAAYEPQNVAADEFEEQALSCLYKLMELAGIDDDPSFQRSTVINEAEEVQVVTQAAQYLSQDYVTRKLLTILGDGDKADEVLTQMQADDFERLN